MTEDKVWISINSTIFENKKRNPDDELSFNWKIGKLSQLLGVINSTDAINEDFTKNTNSLTKMFYSLSTPTLDLERLYSKTIYGPQSRLIMLSSNIVKKSQSNFRLKAKQIFTKISSIIFKKYQNGSIMSRDDVLNIKGNQSPYIF